MKVKYKPVETKSKVLNLYSQPESWFWIIGGINPYRGCEHDCKYCDGKAEWYRIPNFGTNISVKTDISLHFEKELLQLGYTPQNRPIESTLEGFLQEKVNYKGVFMTEVADRGDHHNLVNKIIVRCKKIFSKHF